MFASYVWDSRRDGQSVDPRHCDIWFSSSRLPHVTTRTDERHSALCVTMSPMVRSRYLIPPLSSLHHSYVPYDEMILRGELGVGARSGWTAAAHRTDHQPRT